MTASTGSEETPLHGDYTGLATDYGRFRPDYCPSVLTAVLALLGKPASDIDAVDVGAGTGIWTRMLAKRGLRSVMAIEPNDDMRTRGCRDSAHFAIVWRQGQGEATGLPDQSCDLLSMASSLHWVDLDRGLAEFHRVLRPGGRFVALWNPRLPEASPLLADIENDLHVLAPDMVRVSSGRQGLPQRLTEILWRTPGFDDIVYLEGRHRRVFTPDEYLGVWRSVNDVRVQLGPERFQTFLTLVEERIRNETLIVQTYLTRAWAARRRASVDDRLDARGT